MQRPSDQCDPTHKNPIFYPHADNDLPSARFKVEDVLGKEAAKHLMKNHFQIINVWRPLGPNPIVKNPLAICDYRSLDLVNDIHTADVRGTQATISLYVISHNIQPAQKWYYLSQMRSNEMFIFKIFDSNSVLTQLLLTNVYLYLMFNKLALKYDVLSFMINKKRIPTDFS